MKEGEGMEAEGIGGEREGEDRVTLQRTLLCNCFWPLFQLLLKAFSLGWRGGPLRAFLFNFVM